jgi:acyl-CoA thioesterase-1
MRITLFLLALLFTSPAAMAAPTSKTVLVMGDSLSAGFGMRIELAWPSLLGQLIKEKQLDYSVANLSISGETTAGGLSRLVPALKQHKPEVVIIALGANDGLRGLPLSQMRDNLNAMINASKAAGARVLLIGIRLPPNYGPYAGEFANSFSNVSRLQKVPLVDFLLEPIAQEQRFFLPDNLHPTPAAQPLILNHLWPAIRALLK